MEDQIPPTPSTHDLLAQLSTSPQLVVDFFVIFARFEYALKRLGYIQPNKSYVSPDWGAFARDFPPTFDPHRTPELMAATTYLHEHPPHQQVYRNQTLAWKPRKQDTHLTLTSLLQTIRNVRNNLFHGGKFPSGPVGDPARNQQLLSASMIVLTECLRLHPALHGAVFDSNE